MASDSAESEPQTTHTVEDTIRGRDVTLVVAGPEAQDLEEGTDELGSDIVTQRLRDGLGDVKEELEDEA